MFAERDLLRKVWKKAAKPICENDHPTATKKSKAGEVDKKKSVLSAKAPSIKKTILVMLQRKKLKMK